MPKAASVADAFVSRFKNSVLVQKALLQGNLIRDDNLFYCSCGSLWWLLEKEFEAGRSRQYLAFGSSSLSYCIKVIMDNPNHDVISGEDYSFTNIYDLTVNTIAHVKLEINDHPQGYSLIEKEEFTDA